VTFTAHSTPNVGPYSATRSIAIQVNTGSGWRTLKLLGYGSGNASVQTVSFPRQPAGAQFRIQPYGSGWRSSRSSSGPRLIVDAATWYVT
jgi:hypothetical protein